MAKEIVFLVNLRFLLRLLCFVHGRSPLALSADVRGADLFRPKRTIDRSIDILMWLDWMNCCSDCHPTDLGVPRDDFTAVWRFELLAPNPDRPAGGLMWWRVKVDRCVAEKVVEADF